MLVHGQDDTGNVCPVLKESNGADPQYPVDEVLHAERCGLGLMHRDTLMDETRKLDFKIIALR
jgi:hypothetical protein